MEQNKQSLYKITLFLLYTFSITWIACFVIIFCNKYFNTLGYGELLFWIPYTIGSLGPAISAYIIYRGFKESFAEKTFLKYIFGSKISGKVWLFFGLFLVWRLFMIWFSFGINKPFSILSFVVNMPLIIVLGGVEELGWRGILQPKIERMISYLPSVLIVAILWSLWHLPLWFIEGSVQSGFPFWLYFLSGLVLTASFTTLYKYTNSLLICILSHAWFNYCIGLALFVDEKGVLQLDINWKVMLVFAVELIISIVLAIIYNRRENPKNIKLNFNKQL